MLRLSRPSRDFVRAFILEQSGKPFSYPEVGASRTQMPRGYNVDHNRIRLGQGAGCFERAKEALRCWKMFDMPWIELCWPDAEIEANSTVAVLVAHLGFFSLNASRIVYVMEENDAGSQRYGFAYGTLPEHEERGEEQFTVEYHTEDGAVWYDLRAFSRPGRLARLAYPYTRMLQKRFARDSKTAMRRAVTRR